MTNATGNNRRKEYFGQYIESLDNQPAILAVKEKLKLQSYNDNILIRALITR